MDTIVAETDGESKDYVDGEIAQAKNALVGVGARILFYPTLVHNLIRNKVEAQFHWWDEVDQVRSFFYLESPLPQKKKYVLGGSAFVYQHLLILLPYRSHNLTI